MKISEKQLMRIIKEEIKFALNEGSFGRVKRRIEQEALPFVMISAFRGNLSGRENLERQRDMEMEVSNAGFPFQNMPQSGYVEATEDGEGREVIENSILIWDEERPDFPRSGETLLELAQRLASLYDQDSYVYGDGDSIRGYDRYGAPDPESGPWYSINQVANDYPYWSMIAGKRAALSENLTHWKRSKAGSYMGARRKHYVKKPIRY